MRSVILRSSVPVYRTQYRYTGMTSLLPKFILQCLLEECVRRGRTDCVRSHVMWVVQSVLGVLLLTTRRAAGFGSLRDSELKALEQAEQAAPPSCSTEPCGEPLFLSSLIASNPKAARQASQIEGLEHFEGSFSGLITVDAASKNALFFWYMPAINPPADGSTPPCILWLQGGPGAPSTYGMFTEIGPVIVKKDGVIVPRNHTWNAKYSLLIVDNPAGACLGYRF